MKNILLLSLILILSITSCKKEDTYKSYELSSLEYTNVTKTSATLKAKITDAGNKDILENGFYFGTNKDQMTSKLISSTNGNTFTYEVKDLKPNTTYFFRSFIRDEKEEKLSPGVETFTTDDINVIKTLEPSNISLFSVQLNGKLDNEILKSLQNDGEITNISEYGFNLGTDKDVLSTKYTAEVSENQFSCLVKELKANTSYYYQAYVIDETGKVFANRLAEFKTLITPTTQMKSAENVTALGANLTAEFTNPDQLEIIECGFYTGSSLEDMNKKCIGEITDSKITADFGGQISTKYFANAYIIVNALEPYEIKSENHAIFTTIETSIEMIFVEGGNFMMGSNEGEADAAPVHEIQLSSFTIGKFEVTQKQWVDVMGYNPVEEYEQNDNAPIGTVSVEEIYTYIDKLNQATGLNYRLPTEAEWEFAARGGNMSEGYKYAGSNDANEVAWMNNFNCSQEVGQKKPNELGIYDMSGNVYEVVSDFYNAEYYTESPKVNPQGPASGSVHSMRGGCFSTGGFPTTTARTSKPDYINTEEIGFRLVLPV